MNLKHLKTGKIHKYLKRLGELLLNKKEEGKEIYKEVSEEEYEKENYSFTDKTLYKAMKNIDKGNRQKVILSPPSRGKVFMVLNPTYNKDFVEELKAISKEKSSHFLTRLVIAKACGVNLEHIYWATRKHIKSNITEDMRNTRGKSWFNSKLRKLKNKGMAKDIEFI